MSQEISDKTFYKMLAKIEHETENWDCEKMVDLGSEIIGIAKKRIVKDLKVGGEVVNLEELTRHNKPDKREGRNSFNRKGREKAFINGYEANSRYKDGGYVTWQEFGNYCRHELRLGRHAALEAFDGTWLRLKQEKIDVFDGYLDPYGPKGRIKPRHDWTRHIEDAANDE